MSRIDVLNLEWTSSPSRDRQMATLVCNYLRYQGYSVIEGSVFNGFYLINKYKPRLFFITNGVGAPENFELVKYAKSLNIKVLTLVSEGNFKNTEEEINFFLWGWNKQKILFEDFQLHWSERTRNLSLSYYPELVQKLKVSGGVGFDLYKICKMRDKYEFLKKYKNEKFEQIVGVGCWDFGLFYAEDYRFEISLKQFSYQEIERFKEDGKRFNDILREIIVNNKHILFLIKQHPGTTLGYKASAIDGLQIYDNTLILKNEESVFDCISVSDFWLVYESTTALESWLLGKQTCLLNPSGIDFPRDNVHKGSVAYSTVEDVQNAIDNFYKTNELPGFKNLHEFREEIVKETIQWDDGLNHVRAGNEIINLLNCSGIDKKNEINLNRIIIGLRSNLLWNLSKFHKIFPKLRHHYNLKVAKFNETEVSNFADLRLTEQIEYYKKNNLNRSELSKITCK